MYKCIFSKNEFCDFKTDKLIHYTSQCDEINWVGISKDFTVYNNVTFSKFQNKNVI